MKPDYDRLVVAYKLDCTAYRLETSGDEFDTKRPNKFSVTLFSRVSGEALHFYTNLRVTSEMDAARALRVALNWTKFFADGGKDFFEWCSEYDRNKDSMLNFRRFQKYQRLHLDLVRVFGSDPSMIRGTYIRRGDI